MCTALPLDLDLDLVNRFGIASVLANIEIAGSGVIQYKDFETMAS
jgi:hypothetical protein